MSLRVRRAAASGVLIVHDFAYHYGGAERVTEAFAEAFPDARILALGANPEVLERMGVGERATTILPLGRFESTYRSLAPLFPVLANLYEDQVVISSSYAFAHHVRAEALHVEYCHTPLRQIWTGYREYERELAWPISTGLRLGRRWLQRQDRKAVARVDLMLASCENVRQRIEKIYGRDAEILYPPVDTAAFVPSAAAREPGLALIVARLVEPYKAVSSVLRAFADLPFRLAVVGDGRDADRLRRLAPPQVEFVGELGDAELHDWYCRAEILLFPGQDDFGIVPVEAMACGTPVVALDAGGARETVVNDRTGIRFAPGGLVDAITRAFARQWDHDEIRAHAVSFSKDIFLRRARDFVAKALDTSE